MEYRLKQLMKIALDYHVSDIHFNIKDDNVVIEMRMNNVIKKLKHNESDLRLFRYIQYKSNIDIGNILLPQTGRFELEVNGIKLSLRFSIINSYNLTSGVLRILNAHSKLHVTDLSSDTFTIEQLLSIQNYKSGLFVFSGPTGSGKTTTLYTILKEIKNKKIYTLEDPIEVYSDRFIQLQINEKQDFGYAQGIKQLMRHDPDIIMIGEIRDSVAANMAIRCALTGHLVLTSIHSANCTMAINRLLELGVDYYQLHDVLKFVFNQRLFNKTDSTLKTGIYEIMDRKEILYYLQNKENSPSFFSLEENIKNAVEKNIIEQQTQIIY